MWVYVYPFSCSDWALHLFWLKSSCIVAMNSIFCLSKEARFQYVRYGGLLRSWTGGITEIEGSGEKKQEDNKGRAE